MYEVTEADIMYYSGTRIAHSKCIRPIYFQLPDWQKMYDDEVFLNVPEYLYPDLVPAYMVSNYGRVYNKYTNRFLYGKSPKQHGGIVVALGKLGERDDGTRISPRKIYLGRLVLEVFKPVPYMRQLRVGYVDGDYRNTHVNNLMWVYKTEPKPYDPLKQRESTRRYAIKKTIDKIQQIKKDKAEHGNSFNYQQLLTICAYMEKFPLSYDTDPIERTKYFLEMLKKFDFFGKPNSNGLIETCNGIFERRLYKDISCRYFW